MHLATIKQTLVDYGWFQEPGAYVLVDGQFGSTGKGVIAGALAEMFNNDDIMAVSNAGPNSGHTSYWGGQKIVLKQLPTFGVVQSLASTRHDYYPQAHLTAGAVIDPDVLAREMAAHPNLRVSVDPTAAMIDDTCRKIDRGAVRAIASTGQGVGPALERKLRRVPEAVFGAVHGQRRGLQSKVCFFEVSQGYSLGVNSGFYPHVTTRECTVAQALSDAMVPPTFFRKCVMAVRTYPIRVGNTENSSGPCYPDQKEITWEQLGVQAETTTVTGRIRRVFTWSDMQFRDALRANQPSVIFLNFVNYLPPAEVWRFVENHVLDVYNMTLSGWPEQVLLGFGPGSRDIVPWEAWKA